MIRLATLADATVIQSLIQRAYRGEAARSGWTHEADLIEGERIGLADLKTMIGDPCERMLLAEQDGRLVGCVRVADLGDALAHLGILAVEPTLQDGGLGRTLIAAAEELARGTYGARKIELTVIDTRAELIAYYQRRGFTSGEARPFPYPTPRPVTMIAMTKSLAKAA